MRPKDGNPKGLESLKEGTARKGQIPYKDQRIGKKLSMPRLFRGLYANKKKGFLKKKSPSSYLRDGKRPFYPLEAAAGLPGGKNFFDPPSLK
ncbi:MAG: hypothetical protein ACE5GY_02105 [Thermodesulfobacteriota bacterium]